MSNIQDEMYKKKYLKYKSKYLDLLGGSNQSSTQLALTTPPPRQRTFEETYLSTLPTQRTRNLSIQASLGNLPHDPVSIARQEKRAAEIELAAKKAKLANEHFIAQWRRQHDMTQTLGPPMPSNMSLQDAYNRL